MNKWISVKTAFDRVYHQAGFVPQSKIPNDPESKVMLEQESRKRALAHLEPHDRRQVESCVKRLKECCVGVYYKGLFMMDNGDTWNYTDEGVLAWMPLPEPLRGE